MRSSTTNRRDGTMLSGRTESSYRRWTCAILMVSIPLVTIFTCLAPTMLGHLEMQNSASHDSSGDNQTSSAMSASSQEMISRYNQGLAARRKFTGCSEGADSSCSMNVPEGNDQKTDTQQKVQQLQPKPTTQPARRMGVYLDYELLGIDVDMDTELDLSVAYDDYQDSAELQDYKLDGSEESVADKQMDVASGDISSDAVHSRRLQQTGVFLEAPEPFVIQPAVDCNLLPETLDSCAVPQCQADFQLVRMGGSGAIICMRVGFTVKPTFDTVIIPYTYSYLFSFGLNVVLEGISGGVQGITNLDITSQARQSAFPTLTAETLVSARLAGALGAFAGFEATTQLDVKAQIAGNVDPNAPVAFKTTVTPFAAEDTTIFRVIAPGYAVVTPAIGVDERQYTAFGTTGFSFLSG